MEPSQARRQAMSFKFKGTGYGRSLKVNFEKFEFICDHPWAPHFQLYK
jgi:hypothetical protein